MMFSTLLSTSLSRENSRPIGPMLKIMTSYRVPRRQCRPDSGPFSTPQRRQRGLEPGHVVGIVKFRDGLVDDEGNDSVARHHPEVQYDMWTHDVHVAVLPVH